MTKSKTGRLLLLPEISLKEWQKGQEAARPSLLSCHLWRWGRDRTPAFPWEICQEGTRNQKEDEKILAALEEKQRDDELARSPVQRLSQSCPPMPHRSQGPGSSVSWALMRFQACNNLLLQVLLKGRCACRGMMMDYSPIMGHFVLTNISSALDPRAWKKAKCPTSHTPRCPRDLAQTPCDSRGQRRERHLSLCPAAPRGVNKHLIPVFLVCDASSLPALPQGGRQPGCLRRERHMQLWKLYFKIFLFGCYSAIYNTVCKQMSYLVSNLHLKINIIESE
ncbi:uncharacterized protein [Phaenicophaeus curvirostris]|uniref:uncharacterized protein isoform X2 n=1 Tax=Phaenicophaeus curvirostris TaxID=33595 RepID=UPI0037F0DF47